MAQPPGINLRLSPELRSVVEALAEKDRTTQSDIIRKSIETHSYLVRIQSAGYRIIIGREGEEAKELVIL